MKSKRAKEYLADVWFDGDTHLVDHTRKDLIKAVELAEQDARERAVNAFCKTCKDRNMNGAHCDGTAYCHEIWGFQNNYDNENE